MPYNSNNQSFRLNYEEKNITGCINNIPKNNNKIVVEKYLVKSVITDQ